MIVISRGEPCIRISSGFRKDLCAFKMISGIGGASILADARECEGRKDDEKKKDFLFVLVCTGCPVGLREKRDGGGKVISPEWRTD